MGWTIIIMNADGWPAIVVMCVIYSVCVALLLRHAMYVFVDPEEFLNSLLQQTLKADPLIHLR